MKVLKLKRSFFLAGILGLAGVVVSMALVAPVASATPSPESFQVACANRNDFLRLTDRYNVVRCFAEWGKVDVEGQRIKKIESGNNDVNISYWTRPPGGGPTSGHLNKWESYTFPEDGYDFQSVWVNK